jgi:hypothetical protein
MISLSMWRYWTPSRRPSILWSNPICARRSILKQVQKRDQSVQSLPRILHCNVSPEVCSLVPVHRLPKTTRIRRGKLHFPSHDPHYPQHTRADRAYVPPRVSFSFTAALLDLSLASVMRFLTVVGQPAKAVFLFSGRN